MIVNSENKSKYVEVGDITEQADLVKQIVIPIELTTWIDRQFSYSKSSMQKVYIRVNNEYKQVLVYLLSNPVIIHLTK